tara:strand:+ start:291 stop:551 length:261 start_codon:yes stop_codon:yes gene_type:complete
MANHSFSNKGDSMNILFIIISALIGIYILAIRKEQLFAGIGIVALCAIPFQPVIAISVVLGLFGSAIFGPAVKGLIQGFKQSQLDI